MRIEQIEHRLCHELIATQREVKVLAATEQGEAKPVQARQRRGLKIAFDAAANEALVTAVTVKIAALPKPAMDCGERRNRTPRIAITVSKLPIENRGVRASGCSLAMIKLGPPILVLSLCGRQREVDRLMQCRAGLPNGSLTSHDETRSRLHGGFRGSNSNPGLPIARRRIAVR